MPAGFEWKTIDIMDPVEAQEVYVLLRDNYVEDDDCTFRYFSSRMYFAVYVCMWLLFIRDIINKALLPYVTFLCIFLGIVLPLYL